MQAAQFRPVPFDPAWVHGKPDLKAIYERPVLDEDDQHVVDADGRPRWDLTTPLPVRRHYDWVKKGFRYITLASAEDLWDPAVVGSLRARGLDPASFVMVRNRRVGASPWDVRVYQRDQPAIEQQAADELKTLVEQFGSNAVLAIRRATNPDFTLPAHLQGVAPAATSVTRTTT